MLGDLLSAYLIWFIIGFAFIMAELLLPLFILLFFGIGAWVTSLVVHLADLSLTWQILVFLIASLASLLALRRTLVHHFRGKQADQEPDGLTEKLAGQPAQVTQAIVPPARGEVKFRGSFWPAMAERELPEGAQVVIVGPAPGEPQVLKVKQVQEPVGETATTGS